MNIKYSQETRGEPQEDIEADDTTEKSKQAANPQRRRALMAGLAAAPVVLSLMNRSAWGGPAPVSCNLVTSYVNAGHQWQSPRPANGNGQLAIAPEGIDRCKN